MKIIFWCLALLFVSCVLASKSKAGSRNIYDQSVIQQLVSEHNRYRSQHGARPLKWDANLALFADNYLRQCVNYGGNTVSFNKNTASYRDSGNFNLGENIYGFEKQVGTPREIVAGWYGYAYGKKQMLHKESYAMGCSIRYCQGLKQPHVILCNYLYGPDYNPSEYTDY
ncbi:hypothetical protein AKO1_014376 [Acrasis kona]|uniref:SCP domain-containing protein n=1 Tax=Acrasis kona TaxID=1008807 RepID=A0AAW2Z0D1_9EUKA